MRCGEKLLYGIVFQRSLRVMLLNSILFISFAQLIYIYVFTSIYFNRFFHSIKYITVVCHAQTLTQQKKIERMLKFTNPFLGKLNLEIILQTLTMQSGRADGFRSVASNIFWQLCSKNKTNIQFNWK